MAIPATTEEAPPIRISEIAKRRGLSEMTVRLWITIGLKGKKLKASRAGSSGMWLIREEDLAEFLTTNEDN